MHFSFRENSCSHTQLCQLAGFVGNLQCFSDFYCQEKLVIEINGHIHDFRYVEDKNPKIWINFHSFFK